MTLNLLVDVDYCFLQDELYNPVKATLVDTEAPTSGTGQSKIFLVYEVAYVFSFLSVFTSSVWPRLPGATLVPGVYIRKIKEGES